VAIIEEHSDLNGANIAYHRQLLLRHEARLAEGYWEACLHPILLAEGMRFRSVPAMRVHHCEPFDFCYYLRQRYWFSRAFAGARLPTLSTGQRLASLGAAPLVRVALLARMAGRVRRKRFRRGRFLVSAPLILVALLTYVAGEWIGYQAGPGDVLLKVE